MKKLIFVLVTIVTLVSLSLATVTWDSEFMDFRGADTSIIRGNNNISGEGTWYQNSQHGIVVDPAGKIWVSFYSGYGPNHEGNVEFMRGADTCHYKPLWVFNADGTVDTILTVLTGTGLLDTLYAESDHTGSGRGMELDADGNVVFTSWNTLFKINHQTRELLDRWIIPEGGGLTGPGIDTVNHKIYVTHVVPGGDPMWEIDATDYSTSEQVMSVGYITRSVIAKGYLGGSYDVFTGTTWSGWGVPKYHCGAGPTDTLAIVDTLGNFWYDDSSNEISFVEDTTNVNQSYEKMWASSVDWAPDGNIIAGELRQTWAGNLGSVWWVLDPDDKTHMEAFGLVVVDSCVGNSKASELNDGGVNGPRGASFAPDGSLYTNDFYLWTVNKWNYVTPTWSSDLTAVKPVTTPEGFSLSQNYPNPFNPTTTIDFTLNEAANVKLQVYNLRGQLIETLVDGYKNASTYNVVFDGANYASGTYIYRLSIGNASEVKKMVLLK
jgi:hypothetical protein